MTGCIFCQIIAGERPSSLCYEDDLVIGLMDIAPLTTGHFMVIPKRHATYLADLDEDTGRHMWSVAQRMAAALRDSGVRCEGVNFFLADGEAAFQEVFHVHLHVFPRYAGDPFKLVADWDVRPPRAELDEVAGRIAAAYGRQWSA